MRVFIIKTSLFVVILIVSTFSIIFLADGTTDPYYLKFTSPPQENLIIGNSRAAQGLQPEIFKKTLNKNIFNYAFTLEQSSFGNIYLQSIKRKLKKGKQGIFIIAVDPWSITSWSKNPNDSLIFRENELCLANTINVNRNPNFEYLYKNLKGNYIDMIIPPSNRLFLHDDGWLEVSINMDSSSMNMRLKNSVRVYSQIYLPTLKLSDLRLRYLSETIKYLKNYGTVYLVRLPIHEELMKIENEFMPNFDNVIQNAIQLSNGYLDLTCDNSKFKYTDGNHLYKTSGEEVSNIVANWLKKLQ